SVLGAAIGGALAWLAVQRALGLERPPLGTLAIGVTLLVAVGRLGCLASGCCFGTPTDLPWGVEHPSGTAAWLLHGAMGWIARDAPHSLAVHPYPAYESLGLVVWLAVALHLRRRLVSEAALLALTGAFDLGLRAVIDGARAMLNVPWAVKMSPLGVDYFRLALAAAAVALVALAVILERSARAENARKTSELVANSGLDSENGSKFGENSRRAEPSPLVIWAVFVALCVVGGATDAAQTRILHALLLGTLLAAIPVLPWPTVAALRELLHLPRGAAHLDAARSPHRAWASVLGLALVLPLALELSRAIADDPAAAAGDGRRGWIYQVDPDREAVVRTGSERARTTRLWLGGAGGLSSVRYVSQDSCSDRSTTYDLTGGTLSGRVELELPVAERGAVFLGGRGGIFLDSGTAFEGEVPFPDTTRDVRRTVSVGQLWAEFEHPYFSGGLGIWGQSGIEGAPSLLPSLHLRAGAEAFGVEAGLLDRYAPLGLSMRAGLSGRFPLGALDHQLRYFAGVTTHPGANAGLVMPMLSAEYQLGPGFFVEGMGGAWDDGLFLTAGVRASFDLAR
ncbi:prolipoprotein diacylglyceryl transferase, partial [Myxococcota bacterium]|nr:prolipoprotein diacylglyceryl transferase [Myxococcota bacterium]